MCCLDGMADMLDSKSSAEKCMGSNPTGSTKSIQFAIAVYFQFFTHPSCRISWYLQVSTDSVYRNRYYQYTVENKR